MSIPENKEGTMNNTHAMVFALIECNVSILKWQIPTSALYALIAAIDSVDEILRRLYLSRRSRRKERDAEEREMRRNGNKSQGATGTLKLGTYAPLFRKAGFPESTYLPPKVTLIMWLPLKTLNLRFRSYFN